MSNKVIDFQKFRVDRMSRARDIAKSVFLLVHEDVKRLSPEGASKSLTIHAAITAIKSVMMSDGSFVEYVDNVNGNVKFYVEHSELVHERLTVMITLVGDAVTLTPPSL